MFHAATLVWRDVDLSVGPQKIVEGDKLALFSLTCCWSFDAKTGVVSSSPTNRINAMVSKDQPQGTEDLSNAPDN